MIIKECSIATGRDKMAKITSKIMQAALNASNEFRYTSLNVSIDNKLGVVNEVCGNDDVTDAYNEFWTDAEAANEVIYVHSTFNEGGHQNNDDLHDSDPGIRLSMINQRRALGRVIDKFNLKGSK